jgi:hypothetical protein
VEEDVPCHDEAVGGALPQLRRGLDRRPPARHEQPLELRLGAVRPRRGSPGEQNERGEDPRQGGEDGRRAQPSRHPASARVLEPAQSYLGSASPVNAPLDQ